MTKEEKAIAGLERALLSVVQRVGRLERQANALRMALETLERKTAPAKGPDPKD